MRLDRSLPGVMTSGSGMDTPPTDFLPSRVATVAKEILRAFPHTKRVGNYLLGRTLGEGSFAKVKEAMHTLTGEKVRCCWYIHCQINYIFIMFVIFAYIAIYTVRDFIHWIVI